MTQSLFPHCTPQILSNPVKVKRLTRTVPSSQAGRDADCGYNHTRTRSEFRPSENRFDLRVFKTGSYQSVDPVETNPATGLWG